MQLLDITMTVVIALISCLIIFFIGFGIGYQYQKIKLMQSIKKATDIVKVNQNKVESRPIPEYSQIIDGIRYNSLDAKCIAQGASIFGGWTWLMQTNNNRFFFLSLVPFLDNYTIIRLDQEAAVQAYTSAALKEVKFEAAFPDVEIKDA